MGVANLYTVITMEMDNCAYVNITKQARFWIACRVNNTYSKRGIAFLDI